MPSIPSRTVKRKAANSATTETDSESSRASATDAVFSDNEAMSQTTNQTDVESDSDLSSSSEEPSSESEDDSDAESDTTDRGNNEEITNVRPGTKPEMKLGPLGGGLLQRLKTFLPALEAANQELEKEKKDGTIERRNIEHVEEGDGPFIELDLGLGVLEKKPDDITTGKQDSDSESNESDDDTHGEKKEVDVISKLMGQAKKKQKPAQIEELGEG